MRERGIIFSAADVRATLAGRKTQLRRVVRARNYQLPAEPGYQHNGNAFFREDSSGLSVIAHPCPYGGPGDQLWVRETHALIWPGESPPENERDHKVEYRADTNAKNPGEWPDDSTDCERPKWKPSIFMPRWASRLTLEVTEVRVERLQDISEADARAEGVERFVVEDDSEPGDEVTGYTPPLASLVGSFSALWDAAHGKTAQWSSSPFVWAISFKVVTP